METRFTNQRGLIDNDKLRSTRFVVVGAGAIGSFFVSALSKMGARHITAYDHDSLEDHNFANQLYPISELGKKKVDALASVAKKYGDCTITPVPTPWTDENAREGDIVVLAVDNMDVRRAIFDFYKDKAKFIIDGRMGGLVYRAYGVDLANTQAVAYYESTLYPQSAASPEPCGQKSIIYTVLAVGAQMLSQVKKYLMGEYRPTEVIYDLYNDTLDKTYHTEQVIPVVR